MVDTGPATAVRVQPAFEDPDGVMALILTSGPYHPLARDARSGNEREAGGGRGGSVFVPPWFRRDFATFGEVHVDGAETMLYNDRFTDAALRVFGPKALIEPSTVYVNVMGPCDYPFIAHVDVPVFRGASRRNAPVWLLHLMHASRLFEDERVHLATAVSWFFGGPGGDFHYWPDGPDARSVVESPPFENVAVVADNELTYHGVSPVGADGVEPLTAALTLDAELAHDPVTAVWAIRDRGEIVADYDAGVVRTTVSWKAQVYVDEQERDLVRSGDDALQLATIVDRFQADLAARGLTVADPSDPLADERWMTVLAEAYRRSAPRVPPAAERGPGQSRGK